MEKFDFWPNYSSGSYFLLKFWTGNIESAFLSEKFWLKFGWEVQLLSFDSEVGRSEVQIYFRLTDFLIFFQSFQMTKSLGNARIPSFPPKSFH